MTGTDKSSGEEMGVVERTRGWGQCAGWVCLRQEGDQTWGISLVMLFCIPTLSVAVLNP